MKTSDTVLRKIYTSHFIWKVACERELETEQRLQHIDLPSPSGHHRVSFSFSWAAQPGAWGPSLSGTCSHPSIFSPTGLVSKLTDFLSSPSYIIVQSPTQYLWNGMFDRHQAEITVMQFTGHSLPVHQSMTVPWDFTLSHIVSQARLREWNMHFRRLWKGMFGGVEGQYTTESVSIGELARVVGNQPLVEIEYQNISSDDDNNSQEATGPRRSSRIRKTPDQYGEWVYVAHRLSDLLTVK